MSVVLNKEQAFFHIYFQRGKIHFNKGKEHVYHKRLCNWIFTAGFVLFYKHGAFVLYFVFDVKVAK